MRSKPWLWWKQQRPAGPSQTTGAHLPPPLQPRLSAGTWEEEDGDMKKKETFVQHSNIQKQQQKKKFSWLSSHQICLLTHVIRAQAGQRGAALGRHTSGAGRPVAPLVLTLTLQANDTTT